MRKLMFGLFGLTVSLTWAQTRVTSLTGDIRVHPDFESKSLGNKRQVTVYLPPGYDASPKRRYRVLLMHDGQNIFDGMRSFIPNQEWRADETATSLIEAGLIEPIIIVGVDNAGMDRGNEYLPLEIRAGGGQKIGGKADQYAAFLIDEVLPFIKKTYRVAPGKVGVCGSSFGGIISLHLGLAHPEVFDRIGVFSPSLWVGGGAMTRRVAALPRAFASRFWIDMGTQEAPEAEAAAKGLGQAFVARGWKMGENVTVVIDKGAQHNERAWAQRFPSFLMWMYGRR